MSFLRPHLKNASRHPDVNDTDLRDDDSDDEDNETYPMYHKLKDILKIPTSQKNEKMQRFMDMVFSETLLKNMIISTKPKTSVFSRSSKKMAPISKNNVEYTLYIVVNQDFAFPDLAQMMQIQFQKIINQNIRNRTAINVSLLSPYHHPQSSSSSSSSASYFEFMKLIPQLIQRCNIGSNTLKTKTKSLSPEAQHFKGTYLGKPTTGFHITKKADDTSFGIDSEYIVESFLQRNACNIVLLVNHSATEYIASMMTLHSIRIPKTYPVQYSLLLDVIVNHPCKDPLMAQTAVVGSAGAILIPTIREVCILYNSISPKYLTLFDFTTQPHLEALSDEEYYQQFLHYMFQHHRYDVFALQTPSRPQIESLDLTALSIEVASIYHRYGFQPLGQKSKLDNSIKMTLNLNKYHTLKYMNVNWILMNVFSRLNMASIHKEITKPKSIQRTKTILRLLDHLVKRIENYLQDIQTKQVSIKRQLYPVPNTVSQQIASLGGTKTIKRTTLIKGKKK